MIVKVVDRHAGSSALMSVYDVVKEVEACDVCGASKDQIIESFHSYAEADMYCNALVQNGQAADYVMRLHEPHHEINEITACGEEQP